MSSFITLPSFPVAGTYFRSIAFRLAMLRTAGVARTFSFELLIAALSLVRPTVPVSSDDDDEDDSTTAAFLVSLAGSGVDADTLSSTSISIRALPTGHISSFLYLMLLMTPSCVEGILATSLSVKTSHMSSYYASINYENTNLLDVLTFLHKPLLDGGLLGAFPQIR
jgi:hypothetical protein